MTESPAIPALIVSLSSTAKRPANRTILLPIKSRHTARHLEDKVEPL